MNSAIRKGLRQATASATLETVDIMEMCEDIKVVNFRLVEDNEGILRLHLVNSDSEYYSIKVGKKVVLTASSSKDQIRELINDYVVYTGENNEIRWFTFGPEPTSREPLAVLSFKDLLKGKKTLVG